MEWRLLAGMTSCSFLYYRRAGEVCDQSTKASLERMLFSRILVSILLSSPCFTSLHEDPNTELPHQFI